jgi:hypothetical protein
VADRNPELVDWVTLDRLGSKEIPAPTPTIHVTRMSQRNRMAKQATA